MIVIRTDAIKSWMGVRGIRTQRELAKRAGIREGYLTRILHNTSPQGITLGTLDKLCRALQVNPADLLEYHAD